MSIDKQKSISQVQLNSNNQNVIQETNEVDEIDQSNNEFIRVSAQMQL